MCAFKIGSLMGISLELHSTFIWLFVAIIVFLTIFDPLALIPSVVLLFFLFLSVFVHEIFHSLVAVSKGVRVEKIILLPIGGLSVAEEMPEKPLDEFQIAVAGPLFNFVIVFLIVFVVSLLPWLPWPHYLSASAAVNVEEVNAAIMMFPLFGLFWVNLILGVFNLLPALPLDGGRIFRALLAGVFGFNRATRIASKVGTFFAILLFLLGLLGGNIMLVLIAAFIYLGAGQENKMVLLRETLNSADLSRIIKRDPPMLEAGMSMEDAFLLMRESNETYFPVRLGRGVGFVSAEMFEGIARQKWPLVPLSRIAKKLPIMRLSDGAAKIMSTLMGRGYPFVPVSEKRAFVGIVEESEINKLYALTKIVRR